MSKHIIFRNNCSIEIIPVQFLKSLIIYNTSAEINLLPGRESFIVDSVANTIDPNIINSNPAAGDIYQVRLSFRIAYINADTTMLLQSLKGYNSLIATYRTSGGHISVLGTENYPLQLTYTNPSNFDGYEVVLSGTQDIPPPFITA